MGQHDSGAVDHKSIAGFTDFTIRDQIREVIGLDDQSQQPQEVALVVLDRRTDGQHRLVRRLGYDHIADKGLAGRLGFLEKVLVGDVDVLVPVAIFEDAVVNPAIGVGNKYALVIGPHLRKLFPKGAIGILDALLGTLNSVGSHRFGQIPNPLLGGHGACLAHLAFEDVGRQPRQIRSNALGLFLGLFHQRAAGFLVRNVTHNENGNEDQDEPTGDELRRNGFPIDFHF